MYRSKLINTLWKRFLLASVLWVLFWPVFWFFRIGDITGPKAWFWIIGELSYPVVAVAYLVIDGVLQRSGLKPWGIFLIAVALITALMPFYYQRYGFALGVTIEARYL